MAAQQETISTAVPTGRAGRRGILAAAAGVVAALAAKAVTDPAPVAADGQTWNLPYISGPFPSGTPLAIFNNTGAGIGVAALATSNIGVSGQSNSGTGVYGQTNTGSFSKAIHGQHLTNGYGIYGEATGSGAVGVYGTVTGGYANAIAVQGYSGTAGYGVYGSNTNGIGVYGTVTGGTGVKGNSTTGIGVFGISGGGSATGAQPFGVVGSVNGAPGFALYGIATVSGTVGFAAGASVAGAIAGQFSGPVNIYNTSRGIPGNLYVQGNQHGERHEKRGGAAPRRHAPAAVLHGSARSMVRGLRQRHDHGRQSDGHARPRLRRRGGHEHAACLLHRRTTSTPCMSAAHGDRLFRGGSRRAPWRTAAGKAARPERHLHLPRRGEAQGRDRPPVGEVRSAAGD